MSEAQTSKSRGMYAIITLVSIAALAGFLLFAPEWCWLTFPFVLTYGVKALDAM